MESTTYLKNLRIAPKKLRFFADHVKKMTPAAAVESLLYSPTKPARVFYKSIKSAINNAKQTLKVGDDLLQFKTLLVEEGQKMKRYQPAGRGTANTIKKKFSHIKIVLVAKEGATQIVSEKKEEPKEKEIAKADATVKTAKPKTKAKMVKKVEKEEKDK